MGRKDVSRSDIWIGVMVVVLVSFVLGTIAYNHWEQSEQEGVDVVPIQEYVG